MTLVFGIKRFLVCESVGTMTDADQKPVYPRQMIERQIAHPIHIKEWFTMFSSEAKEDNLKQSHTRQQTCTAHLFNTHLHKVHTTHLVSTSGMYQEE